ncbi:MAG: hypothetical protein ABT15_17765 [Pseudonocardia sp. SCN 73-27]|nr:MAG: hypothetical protein ABS80_05180 [Pseudonocardia sp. SCN 72-51]ODV05338.1 MAG: hypothetical protein ABT15_17765 [Pseudonocardia sp. SCN 73-27]
MTGGPCGTYPGAARPTEVVVEERVRDLSGWQDLIRERFVALDIRPGAGPAVRGRSGRTPLGRSSWLTYGRSPSRSGVRPG